MREFVRGVLLAVAGILGMLAVVMLQGCGKIVIPPLDCRVLGCPADSQCQPNETKTAWSCVPIPPPEPPPPPPAPVCPATCPAGYHCDDPELGCVKDPEPVHVPVAEDCYVLPAPGTVYIVNKALQTPGRFDATPRVKDKAFCQAIYHDGVTSDCHLEGMPKPRKVWCEMYLIGGCPVWQFSANPGGKDPIQCHDDQSAAASCDHFGSQDAQDDPKTKDVFEGRPEQCGWQRDSYGPNAGFFMIGHGKGYARACLPNNPTVCGAWRPFDH